MPKQTSPAKEAGHQRKLNLNRRSKRSNLWLKNESNLTMAATRSFIKVTKSQIRVRELLKKMETVRAIKEWD